MRSKAKPARKRPTVKRKRYRVLVVGDTHCPVMHEDYIDHLRQVYREYRCDRVVFIGDVIDLSSVSYHEKDPEMPAAAHELAAAMVQVEQLKKAFPKASVMTGNHDCLGDRKAVSSGIPREMMRKPKQFLRTPGWRWYPSKTTMQIDKVKYAHGDRGKSGAFAAYKNAVEEGSSYVMGHLHTQGGVWYHANESKLIFGLSVGCGIDRHAIAMRYAAGLSQKPLLGCGVVIEGTQGFFIPMEM